MKITRIVLVAILSISLPLYGQAALDLSDPCELQMPAGPGMHDCCPGHAHHGGKAHAGTDGKAKSGHLCKHGQDCKACNAYQPSSDQQTIVFHVLQVSRAPAAFPDEIILSRSLDALWRPPRLV